MLHTQSLYVLVATGFCAFCISSHKNWCRKFSSPATKRKLWRIMCEVHAAGSASIGGKSRWRCVTYIQQLQMHLFCSEAASALPSLSLLFSPSSLFHLMLSLPAATHLVHRDLSHSDHFRCSSARLPLTSGGFPVPSLLSILSFPVSLPCLFYVGGGGWR